MLRPKSAGCDDERRAVGCRKQLLKSEPYTELRSERDADRRARAKEIAERSRRNQELLAARHRHRRSARRIQAHRRHVVGIIDGKNRNVGHEVRARIIAVEKVEKLEERYGRPALMEVNGTADAQISLNVW